MGNPEPKLLAEGVLVREASIVGKGKNRKHARLTVDAGGLPMGAIAFGMADILPPIGAYVDLVYVPEINRYNGHQRLQLNVKAMRLSV